MHRKNSRPARPQDTFDLRLVNSPRQYNALTDPHANYYFVSSAAKQRLKDLKRQLRRQKNGKSSDQKQMLKLIREKIHFKFPKLQLPLVNQKELNTIIATSRQHSEQGLPKASLAKLPVPASRQEYAVELASQDERERLQTDTKKSFSCNKPQKRKSVNHSDFIQFLAERKSQLLDLDHS